MQAAPVDRKTAVSRPECCWRVGAELGEGPLWSTTSQCLWFVDILGCRLHRFDPANGDHRSWETPSRPGFIAELDGGGLLVGLTHGLYRFDVATGHFELLVPVEQGRDENRLNDGAVGPDGRLWFGTKNEPETAATGGWFSWSGSGAPIKHEEGYVVTNGPAFSPDGLTLYHCDSTTGRVLARSVSGDGQLGENRLFAQIPKDGGYPDGLAVDIEGCVWVGLFAGWSVRRYAPDGRLLETIALPCAHVTKPALGGPDGRTLFLTTASIGLDAVAKKAQALAGGLFSARVEVPGRALPLLHIATPNGDGNSL
jgi:xylono-1,5-lactonase